MSDDKRKASYDQFGHAAFQGGGDKVALEILIFHHLSDIFEDVFGDLGDFGFASSEGQEEDQTTEGVILDMMS